MEFLKDFDSLFIIVKIASNVTRYHYFIDFIDFNLPTTDRGGEMDKTLLG